MKTTSQIGNAKTHSGNILVALLGPIAPCQRPLNDRPRAACGSHTLSNRRLSERVDPRGYLPSASRQIGSISTGQSLLRSSLTVASRRRRRSVCLRERKDLASSDNPAACSSIASVLAARGLWTSRTRCMRSFNRANVLAIGTSSLKLRN